MEKLDLQKIREEIDIIDRELARLFEKRMDIVLKVAEYKRQNNLPVKDMAREEKSFLSDFLLIQPMNNLHQYLDF